MAKSTERVVPLEPTIRDYDEYLINNMGYISSEKNWRPDFDKLHDDNIEWSESWQTTFNKWIENGYKFVIIDIFSNTFIPSKAKLDSNHIGRCIELNGKNFQAIQILITAHIEMRKATLKAYNIINNWK
jgi:predicted RNA-binding protein YlqC (UPF0109 family)